MKKIPTLFERDYDNNGIIIPQYNEAAQWVVNGEGVATRKYDGTCVLIRDGKMYKRYELRPGKVAPPDFEEVDRDKTTGKAMGWVQVDGEQRINGFAKLSLAAIQIRLILPNIPTEAMNCLGLKSRGIQSTPTNITYTTLCVRPRSTLTRRPASRN